MNAPASPAAVVVAAPRPTPAWRSQLGTYLGLLAVLAGALGFDASGLDTGAVAEALVQVVAAGSFVASTLFRILATRQIRN